MKKMQKILCMLLALAMLLSFAACAAKEAAPSTTDTPAADAADAKTETKAEDTPAEQPAAELPELTLMLQTSDESNGLLAAVDYVNAHAEEIGAKLILEKVPDGDQGEQVIQVRYAGGEDVPDILYFQPVSYTNSRLSVADNFVDLTANDYSYLYSDSYLRTPATCSMASFTISRLQPAAVCICSTTRTCWPHPASPKSPPHGTHSLLTAKRSRQTAFLRSTIPALTPGRSSSSR